MDGSRRIYIINRRSLAFPNLLPHGWLQCRGLLQHGSDCPSRRTTAFQKSATPQQNTKIQMLVAESPQLLMRTTARYLDPREMNITSSKHSRRQQLEGHTALRGAPSGSLPKSAASGCFFSICRVSGAAVAISGKPEGHELHVRTIIKKGHNAMLRNEESCGHP